MVAEPPALPQEALYGPIGQYVEVMHPTTEAPLEFHYGAIVTVLSVLFGQCHVRVAGSRLYPTVFSILTGGTGVTHKTTVARQVLDLLDRVDPDVVVLRGSGSREGLLKNLPDGGAPVLWRAAEFTQQLRKAGTTGTANLVEFWLELYDRPPSIEHRLAKETTRKTNPCVAMLSDSTESYLTEVASDAAIGNGLLNRLCIWMGTPGGPIAFPPNPDTTALNMVVKEIRAAIDAAATVSELTATEEALAHWREIYADRVYAMQHGPQGEVHARLFDMTWKVAMIYTLADQRTEIHVDDVVTGWAVAEYLAKCSERIAGQLGASEKGRLFDAVEVAVRTHGPLPSPGYLKRHLGNRSRAKLDDYGGSRSILERLHSDERIDFAEGVGYFVKD